MEICLETPRLYLTKFLKDKEAIGIYQEWMHDRTINKWFSQNNGFMPLKEIKEWAVENYNLPYSFSIVNKINEELIGRIKLQYISSNRYVLCICIGNKSSRNKGLGTEAVNRVVDFAFEDLAANSIELTVIKENMPAVRCYEKCGFIRTGVHRQTDFYGGQYHDSISMDILRSDWENKRGHSDE